MSTVIDKKDSDFLEVNLKGLCDDLAEWLDLRNRELREQSGLIATPAEARLFARLRGRPRTVSSLARALGVSRQAVHKTVKRLAERGVVRVEHAPGNRRDKLVVITDAGHLVRRTVAANFRKLEGEVREMIGADSLEQLRALLFETVEATRRCEDSDSRPMTE